MVQAQSMNGWRAGRQDCRRERANQSQRSQERREEEREEEGLEAAWDKKIKKVERGNKNNIQVST